MTEEQAKTKWCPMARKSCSNHPEHGNHASNRYDDGTWGEEHNCIASECMMWRWKPADSVQQRLPLGSYEKSGYCGLAR